MIQISGNLHPFHRFSNFDLEFIAVCISRLVMISIDLSETTQKSTIEIRDKIQSETISENFFFSNKNFFATKNPNFIRKKFSDFCLGLNFVSDYIPIGGSRGHCWCPPSQRDPILSFSHTFSPKSTCIRGWHPHPPMGNPGSATDTAVVFRMQSFN